LEKENINTDNNLDKSKLSNVSLNDLKKNNDIKNLTTSSSENSILDCEKNNNRFLLNISNNTKQLDLIGEKLNDYFNLLEKHKKFVIPYTDHLFYHELLNLSNEISGNAEAESWYILEQYTELNIEILSKENLVDIIQSFSKIKFFRFKFWYTIENRLVKEYKDYSNTDLAKIIYCLAYAEKGSDYIYRILSEEVMKRKISTFNQEEFILIYNAYNKVKIRDKMFNLMLEKARKELYSNL